jgi:NAD(P)-dependent dehydrogenase (short-subunit alcohol dehydrogenase family)
MKNYFDLSGQVAVVTGASGGLGLQMAKAFANQGASLVLMARRIDLLETNAKEIQEKYGVKVLAVQCDVSQTDQVKSAVNNTMETFGRVDILLNDAGIGGGAPATEVTDEQFKRELDVDLFGCFVCAREFAKEMIKAKYGRIINVASVFGLVGNLISPLSPYHAAKGGVVNLTRALADEWGKYGITVNAICPGPFVTPLTKEWMSTPEFQAFVKASFPVQRLGQEGELDTCALFLASPYSAFVTGQNIAVDGGYCAA